MSLNHINRNFSSKAGSTGNGCVECFGENQKWNKVVFYWDPLKGDKLEVEVEGQGKVLLRRRHGPRGIVLGR